MTRLGFFSLLSVVVSAHNVTLMRDVYGEAKPVHSMQPRWQTAVDRALISNAFKATRTADNCVFPIDLIILQDATASFQDDFANMANTQLDLMYNALSASHPGSQYGVVSFRDIPISTLGTPATDYCQKFDQSLTDDFAKVKTLYTTLQSIGGGDPPENQFGALIAAANAEGLGYGGNPDAATLVVVVTDAAPHFNADGFNKYGLKDNSGTFNAATAEADCTKQYYPSPAQVKDNLLRAKMYMGALVYDSQYDNYQPRDSWTWFNNYLGQLPAFYHDINEDSSNFWEVLSTIITAMEDVECGPATTTTSPEVTPAGTTEAPPTTAATTTVAPTTAAPEGTLPPSCGVCPNPCPPEGCDPCCTDGVLIKLRHRPARLHLEIENPPAL